MSKIVIHAGLHKTGTSAIQKALYQNRDFLWNNNCFYPESEPFMAHHTLAARLSKAPSIKKGIKDAAQTLMAYKKSADGKTVIISSEMFSESFNPAVFKKINETFRAIDVVFYVRQQDEFIESAYNQTVKRRGESRTIEEFQPPVLDIHKHLKRFQRAMRGANIFALEYKKKYWVNGNLIDDFIYRVLGLPSKGISCNNNKSIVNASLSPVACAILCCLNKFDMNEEMRKCIIKDLTSEFPNEKYGMYTLISPKYRTKIISKTIKSNSKLKKKYLKNGYMEFDDHSDKIFLDSHLLSKFIKGSKVLNKLESRLNFKLTGLC